MSDSADSSPEFDVVIVGLGPVGAALANLLAIQNLRILVLESESDVYRLPRAISIDGECMRILQTSGAADLLLPGLFVSPGTRFVDAQGELLVDWRRGGSEVGPHAWHESYRFHQPTLETCLRDCLKAFGDVHVRLEHQVIDVKQDSQCVAVTCINKATGKSSVHTAHYVVGCDGARSFVRGVIGSQMDDLKSHERWLVIDVVLKGPRPDLGEHTIQYCNPARPATYVRGPGNRRRWELMLMPGEDTVASSTADNIWRLLSAWVTPENAELERPAVYTFHSVVATRWRNGRLMIAGDAAHQTPPFMGQGMCAGIRDAFNLAWKLGEVLRGAAADTLLDTYESERTPNVRTFIETALWMGRLIQARTPDELAQRAASFAVRPFVMTTPRPALGPGWYDDSIHAGRMANQPQLADGRRMDDLIGYRYGLIALPELASAMRRNIPETIAARVAILAAEDEALHHWLREFQAEAVLLRPDRCVFGVAQGTQDTLALLNRATGPVAA